MTYTSTSSNSGKSNGKIKSDIQDAFKSASEHIDDVTKEVKDHVHGFTNEVVKNVKSSPIKSVLIAGIVGVLFGKLFL